MSKLTDKRGRGDGRELSLLSLIILWSHRTKAFGERMYIHTVRLSSEANIIDQRTSTRETANYFVVEQAKRQNRKRRGGTAESYAIAK